MQELQRQRVEQERTLQEVEDVVQSQDALFQDLSSKVQTATDRWVLGQ